jgi:hypothetical protein
MTEPEIYPYRLLAYRKDRVYATSTYRDLQVAMLVFREWAFRDLLGKLDRVELFDCSTYPPKLLAREPKEE